MIEIHSDVREKGKSSKKFSRRNFLRLAGVVALGAAANYIKDETKDIWEPKVVDLGIEILENPATIESILVASAGSLEELALRDNRAEGAPRIEANPSYRPMAVIIGEVLDQRRKEGKPITYQRVLGYEDLPFYLDKVRKAAHDPKNRDRAPIETGQIPADLYFLGYMPGTLTNIMYQNGFFPKSVQRIWDMSSTSFFSSRSLAGIESGFLDKIIKKFGVNWQTYRKEEIEGVLTIYLQEMKQHVEMLVKQTGKPVSAGTIFSYGMDGNTGSINKSLFDTMSFLKYMARSDISLTNLNEKWFKENILDEYRIVGGYSRLPVHKTYPYRGALSGWSELAGPEVDKDLHLLNQMGIYHSWNFALILTAVPATMAQIGVAWRQKETFSAQGSVKTAAIFRAALEANKLESLFQGYP